MAFKQAYKFIAEYAVDYGLHGHGDQDGQRHS